jgi:phosphoribosylaminoimidazolecarboxamide formyltransferase/IMP cyclohydrolase
MNGNISSVTVDELRKQFMLEAFKHTAEYDAAISDWMEGRVL